MNILQSGLPLTAGARITHYPAMFNPVYSVLRFMFAAAIVGFHFWPGERTGLSAVFGFGQIYVTFFFVLSGYLTHLSACRKWNSPGEFIVRKLLSLLPLYLAVLCFCILVDFYYVRWPLNTIMAHFALVQAWIPNHQLSINGPAWFMSALAFCLVCYPWLRWLKQRTGFSWGVMAIGFWIVVQGLTMGLEATELSPSLNYWVYFPVFHLGSFGLGIAAADLHLLDNERRFRGGSVLVPLAFVLLIGAAIFSLKWLPEPVIMASNITLFAPLFAGLVWSLNQLPVSSLHTMNYRWVGILGAMAFPIYLLQLPIMNVFRRSLESRNLELTHAWFGIYFCSLLLVSAGWLVFEKLLVHRLLGSRLVQNWEQVLSNRSSGESSQ